MLLAAIDVFLTNVLSTPRMFFGGCAGVARVGVCCADPSGAHDLALCVLSVEIVMKEGRGGFRGHQGSPGLLNQVLCSPL